MQICFEGISSSFLYRQIPIAGAEILTHLHTNPPIIRKSPIACCHGFRLETRLYLRTNFDLQETSRLSREFVDASDSETQDRQ
jgi:hypothetical protein